MRLYRRTLLLEICIRQYPTFVRDVLAERSGRVIMTICVTEILQLLQANTKPLLSATHTVMPGEGPASTSLQLVAKKDVDVGAKPRHDGVGYAHREPVLIRDTKLYRSRPWATLA